MTREELLKMSKKDLKNRLAELGKNAQTLSGQELTDAMDEARTIGEILDEIKGREELEAAARAAGAADPDEGDGAGEGSGEPQDQERAKRGKTLKDGKKAFFKGKALAGIKNTLTTATGVVMPKHTSPDISPRGSRTSVITGLNGYSVYNKKHYQLTHLLEKGHQLRKGGRKVGNVKAFEHIAPVNETLGDLAVSKIRQKVRG